MPVATRLKSETITALGQTFAIGKDGRVLLNGCDVPDDLATRLLGLPGFSRIEAIEPIEVTADELPVDVAKRASALGKNILSANGTTEDAESAVRQYLLERGYRMVEKPKPAAKVERIDGRPLEKGEDGLVHGDRIDLTDEQRAALPKLDPKAKDDPAKHVTKPAKPAAKAAKKG